LKAGVGYNNQSFVGWVRSQFRCNPTYDSFPLDVQRRALERGQQFPKSPKKSTKTPRDCNSANEAYQPYSPSIFQCLPAGVYCLELVEQTVVTQQSNSVAISKKVWLALWLVIFGLLFAWRAQNLDAFGLSNDEGAHLMWAKLAVDGYPLYSETQAVQAPLFIESIGLALRLAGPSIQTGRWVTLIAFALLAVALSWLAHRVGGWPASLMALVLLGISPLVFTYSRFVMAEIPATTLAVASVAFLILYVDKRGRDEATRIEGLEANNPGFELLRPYFKRGWLIVSGLMLGLSFITKALYPFVVIPVGLLLWIHHTRGQTTGVFARLLSLRKDWQALIVDSLLWGIGVTLPVIAVFFIYDPSALYDQLVVFRGDLRAALPGSRLETWGQFELFFMSHWGFWLLAFGGIMATVFRVIGQSRIARDELSTPPTSRRLAQQTSQADALYYLIWIVWLMAGMALLWWHTPLFPHQFIVLLPSLILLATGMVTNFTVLWSRQRHNGLVFYGGSVILLLVLLGAAVNVPSMVAANQKTAAIVTGGREQEALQLLDAVSNPDDFLMGDSQLLIFKANRQTPPPLGDVALVAIQAGRQTSAKMIDLTQAYRSPAVVQWSLRLPWLSEYLAWIDANYLARRIWDNDHIIYFGQRIPEGQAIPNERDVRLGDSLVLRGYELGPIVAGQDVNLKVYWQTSSPLADDYTVFTQLLDSSGALVVGRDSQPLGGFFPTSQWPENEIITDMVRLSLPADLPAGEYSLITGMYQLETLERLPVLDTGSDNIVLTTVEIE